MTLIDQLHRSPARCGGIGLAIAGVDNAPVDRLDAIRLMKALVAAGATTRAPMSSAWIDEIAVRDMALHGTALVSAIAYARAERWLADSRTREDRFYLTRLGQAAAKEGVV